MKKRMIVGLLMLAFMGSAMAQTQEQIDQMRREKIAMFNKRDISQQHLNGKFAHAPATQTSVKGDAKGELALPADRWFPGEWEEVKAIVVTCYYNYYPVDHIGDMYWTADPVVSGYADYYHYSNGWQQSGGGDYVAIPDTSDDNFANVFFYIMDAIQLGARCRLGCHHPQTGPYGLA